MRFYKKSFLKRLVLGAVFLCFLNDFFTREDRSETSKTISSSRELSIYLGNGTCEWTLPTYDPPATIDFYKTLIVGYPSGDKRLTFVQMEALTGWAAKDEWDFEHLGISNEPFVKANYPHHEGIWGWEDVADQVVMVVRNIRRSMVEYHDILWDIGYAKTWQEANLHLEDLYRERPPLSDFLEWRDLRVMDEVHWYGWFIDYWMEEGLLRDIFTHKITTPEHWALLMMPTVYPKSSVTYDLIVGNATVTPSYDPHCAPNSTTLDVSGGCRPVQIISAERLVLPETGPSVNRQIAQVLASKPGIAEYLIDEDAWECIWTELIINKKGLKTFIDREGVEERDYNFSTEMLAEMLHEMDRLIIKYGSSEWNHLQTSNDLVELFGEHRALIQAEYDDVAAGTRTLSEFDFLGPKERERRRSEKIEKELEQELASGRRVKGRRQLDIGSFAGETKKDYSDFFNAVDKKLLENRKAKLKSQVFSDDAKRREWQRNLGL